VGGGAQRRGRHRRADGGAQGSVRVWGVEGGFIDGGLEEVGGGEGSAVGDGEVGRRGGSGGTSPTSGGQGWRGWSHRRSTSVEEKLVRKTVMRRHHAEEEGVA
jgi:hypothetical protein